MTSDKKHPRRGLLAAAAAATLAVMAAGCSDPNQEASLTSSLEYMWDDMQDPIEEAASDYCRDLESDPGRLMEDCQVEWDDFLDCLTVTIPIDWGARAATSLLFGDFFSDIDDLNRLMKDKPEVKKQILKSFNDNWASMMIYVVAREGSLDYVVETDNIVDNIIDFDTRELYKILIDKGYFQAGYGDPLPGAD